MSIGPGWIITVAAMSSNVPALSSNTFPPPDSSAGCAEQHDLEAEVVGHLGQCERGADGRGRDDVVAAGVSEPRQRVVFGADADHQRAAAELGTERRVQPAGRSGDLEAVLGDQRLRLGAALDLGERQLGLGVDGVRQLDQIATAPVDCVFDADGGGGGGHLRSISLTAKLLKL